VVGVDQSPQMLEGARERIGKAGLSDRIELRLGSAEELDLAEGSFDALTAGYLLRYVDDPLRTLTDLLGLVRPGGPFALLDFSVPPNMAARGLWHLYTGVGLPVLGRMVSPGWADVGRYLRPSITAFDAAYPPPALRELLLEAGAANVNTRRLSLGGGLVAWGVRAVR
jgi:demethylmenaquinone methyltransferase/2-methoxy-6-polyprenyl-1,4-benzoquinol methylase